MNLFTRLRNLNLGKRLQALPWVVLAAGLGMTGIWCEQLRGYKQLEHERIERDLAQEISSAVVTRLQTNIAVLDSVIGLFDASTAVTQQEFHEFYMALNRRGDTLKGIQGVGYAAVVPDGEVEAFERRVRASGQPEFVVKPPGRRDVTTAILYLEPNDWRNQRAIGFDMYSQITRREAMQLAANTGEPALSGPVRLLQENSIRPQVGALIYQAVYKQPDQAFTSGKDRLNRLRGWAYSPLRMEDLINGALSTIQNSALNGTGVLVYDSSRSDPNNLLFDNFKLADSKQLTHPTWFDVTIANRTWIIGIQLDHRSLSPAGWSQQLLLQALLGVSLSVLASVITQQLIRNHLAVRSALVREQESSRERALAGAVFDSSPLAIVVTNPAGVIIQVNPAFSQLTGYSNLEAKGNKTNLLRSGRHDHTFYEELWNAILQRGFWNGEIWNRHRNGQIIRHELSITAVFDQQQQIANFVGLLRDVTERHEQEEKMRFMATHDQLTGLANRTLLIEELNRSIALAKRKSHGVGLLFLDLNNFKPVNDRFGHSAGDALLKAVGKRLLGNVRASDTLCRQGGDEFVLLVPDAPELDQLVAIAEKLELILRQPFHDQPDLPSSVVVSASIGVARWPDHARDADSLIEAADTAMYEAKSQKDEQIAVAKTISISTVSESET
jgi:diguanylate cyclase (GGDEF)-like protein/PAS domain S-box-containing protein